MAKYTEMNGKNLLCSRGTANYNEKADFLDTLLKPREALSNNELHWIVLPHLKWNAATEIPVDATLFSGNQFKD